MKRISESTTDAVAFGRPYIANPDLPERFPVNAPLTEPNHSMEVMRRVTPTIHLWIMAMTVSSNGQK